MGTLSKSTKKDWKPVAVSRGESNRRLRQEVKRQKERAEKWRARFHELKINSSLRPTPRHSYPLELIWLAIWMRIGGNVSLRGISQCLVKWGELNGLRNTKFSPTTIRNWCLKYGLYALLRPIPTGKYVLICDESVEIGREHLMLVLAIPIQSCSPIAPLRMEDVRVLDLAVQRSWKGQELAQMIQAKQQQYGLEFVYGISDKGHVLRNAYALCNITWVGDCTHQIANSAKAIFRKDEAFNTFIKQLNALRAKWIMSKNNFYVPPALRAKTRFHQLFVVHKWAQHILQQWDTIAAQTQLELAFLQQARSTIAVMKHFHDLIDAFAGIFKARGIQKNSLEQWTGFVANYRKENSLSDKAEQFIGQMNIYLEQQQAKFSQQRQILCCSDIIESMFGKYKNKGGMKMITEDVLKIAAYPEEKKLEHVRQAMQKIRMVDVKQWKTQHTTVSKLALIKKASLKSTA